MVPSPRGGEGVGRVEKTWSLFHFVLFYFCMQMSHVTCAHARWPESPYAHTNAEFVRCGGAVPRGSNTLDPDSAQPCAPEAMPMARVVAET